MSAWLEGEQANMRGFVGSESHDHVLEMKQNCISSYHSLDPLALGLKFMHPKPAVCYTCPSMRIPLHAPIICSNMKP